MWQAFKYNPSDLSAEQVEDAFAIISWAEEGSKSETGWNQNTGFLERLPDGMTIIIFATEWDDLWRFSRHLDNITVIEIIVIKYRVLLQQEPKSC